MKKQTHETLTPSDVQGAAFTWDGDDDLLYRIQATADALHNAQADLRVLARAFLTNDFDESEDYHKAKAIAVAALESSK